MSKKKKCKECGAELIGESISYPELCLDCIIEKGLK
jgi:hypothetical protein|tara:strand:- start:539 stop:646 length:108 start_codon:yes stop_codon:yes gene_type:complete